MCQASFKKTVIFKGLGVPYSYFNLPICFQSTGIASTPSKLTPEFEKKKILEHSKLAHQTLSNALFCCCLHGNQYTACSLTLNLQVLG